MPPACQFLTISTSKSLSRAGVAQILSRSTSKSAPGMPVFKDFDFQIALARRRGANFVDILDSRSFATPVFRSYLCELSKRQNYGKTQHFAQFLPAKTSLLSNIDAATTGNFQYSRKLELLNFLWWYIYVIRIVYITYIIFAYICCVFCIVHMIFVNTLVQKTIGLICEMRYYFLIIYYYCMLILSFVYYVILCMIFPTNTLY